MPSVTTLPLSPQVFWPFTLLAGLLLAALLIHHLLDGLDDSRRSRLWDEVRPGWLFLAIMLAIVWLGLFTLTIAAAFFGLWQALPPAGATLQPNLGLGALLAALLGAPFVIWGTVLKHQSLRYQKEGHITDRISKAVEQLGAEKKVDRIGRPVTIWFDQLPTFLRHTDDTKNYLNKPRTLLSVPEWQEFWDPETNDHEEGMYFTVTSYHQERTVIQWQGDPLHLADGEVIGSEGEWKVFSESLPNIEVRIGAILSLERIAQDSTKHDKGRDHVRVMEILCAYIRENAPATDLTPTEGEFTTKIPRIDLQMAVTVLGRRSDVQQKLEEKARYRLDLSRSDLDGMNFSKGSFRGALFNRSRVEAANFWKADLTGARFRFALLNDTNFHGCKMLGMDMAASTCTRTGFTNFLTDEIAAYVEAADISGLPLTSVWASHFFGSSDTTVDDELTEKKKLAFMQMRQGFKVVDGKPRVEIAPDADMHDNEKLFIHWNPFTADDLIAPIFREAFRDRWNLRGWPFDD